MSKILRFTVGEPLMHVRTFLSFSSGFSLSLLSLSLFLLSLPPCISFHFYLSSSLFLFFSFLFISSSLLFASVSVLCCAVLCCVVVCCGMWLCCVCGYVCWGRGGGVYASNTSPCARSKHGVFSVSHHTPHPHPQHTRHSTQHNRTPPHPHYTRKSCVCGSICLNTGKLTRSRHSKD